MLEAVRNIWACVDANVRPGENLVILASSDLDEEFYGTVAAAAEAKGADPLVVIIKPPKESGELSITQGVKFPKALAAVCKSADVVCQLTTFAFGFSAPYVEAMKSGVRWFGFPTYYGLDATSYTDLKNEEMARTKAKVYADFITKAKTFRVLSDGECLEGKLGRLAYALSYVAEPPHNCGYWGVAGEAMVAPMEGTAEGSIVVDGAIGTFGMVKRPVKFTIKKGVLVNIEDPEYSQEIKLFLEKRGDKNSKMFCELAVGTNPAARLHDAAGIHEIKEGIGRIHMAFGENATFAGGHPKIAGKISSMLHWDVVLLNATLELDGKVVVEKGKLIY